MKKIAITTCVVGGAALLSSLCGGVATAATAQPTTAQTTAAQPTPSTPAPKQDDESKMNTAQREAARKSIELDLESTSVRVGGTVNFAVLTCGDTVVRTRLGTVENNGMSTGDYVHYRVKVQQMPPGKYPIVAECSKKDGSHYSKTAYVTVLSDEVVHHPHKVIHLPGTGTVRNGDEVEFIGNCAETQRAGIGSSNAVMARALRSGAVAEGDSTMTQFANFAFMEDVPDGTYPVYYKCGGHKITGSVTVGSAKPVARPTSNSSEPQQVSVKPVGAADTGDGTEAAQATQPGSGWLLAGGAGIAGLAGASAFALRRKSLR